MKSRFRDLNGDPCTQKECLKQWGRIRDILYQKYGLQTIGFDPGILACDAVTKHGTADLPMWLVRRMVGDEVFWHSLSEEEKKSIFAEAKRKKMRVGEFMAKYRQPPWCSWTEACSPLPMGCFSLMGCNGAKVRTIKDCHKCDLIYPKKGK